MSVSLAQAACPRDQVDNKPLKKKKSPFPPGFTTSELASVTLDFRDCALNLLSREKDGGERKREDAPTIAVVHTKSGDSFSVSIKAIGKIIAPEHLVGTIVWPGGAALNIAGSNSPIEVLAEQPSISTRMIRVEYGLACHFADGSDFERALGETTQALASGAPNLPQLVALWPADRFVTDAMRELLALQCIELVRAKLLLARHDEPAAGMCLSRAEALNEKLIELGTRLGAPRRSRGKKGGEGGAAKFASLRQECTKLLLERRPTGGWKSHSQAARAIHDEVLDYVEGDVRLAARLGKSPEQDLTNKIARWISRYPAMKHAYSGGSS